MTLYVPRTMLGDAMDDIDEGEFEDFSAADYGEDQQTLRRDYVLYLLREIEGALGRALPLSRDDATVVGAGLIRLAATVIRHRDPRSD
jgi:hypothetical protein